MKKRRAEREAARAAKEAMDKEADARRRARTARPPTPKSKESQRRPKPTSAPAPQTRQSRRQRLRSGRLCSSRSRGSMARARARRRKLLAEALGPETLLIREPGGTDAAERIRELLADPASSWSPRRAAALLGRPRRPHPAGDPSRRSRRAPTSSPTASPTPASPTRAARAGSASASHRPLADRHGDRRPLARPDDAAAGRPRGRPGPRGGEDRFESEGLDLQRAVADAYEEIAIRSPPTGSSSSTPPETVEEVHGGSWPRSRPRR